MAAEEMLKSILDAITHVRDRVEKVIDIATEHTGQLAGLEERTKNQGAAMVELSNRLGALKVDIDETDKRVDAVAKEALAEIKKKADVSTANKLDTRLRWVERIVYGLVGMAALVGAILSAIEALKK